MEMGAVYVVACGRGEEEVVVEGRGLLRVITASNMGRGIYGETETGFWTQTRKSGRGP